MEIGGILLHLMWLLSTSRKINFLMPAISASCCDVKWEHSMLGSHCNPELPTNDAGVP